MMNKYIVLKPHRKPVVAVADTDDRIVSYEAWNAFKSLSKPSFDYIECVDILDNFVLLIDEEGKLKDNWKINECASFLYGALPYDFIVNTAVLVARDELEPGELRYLTDNEVSHIINILSTPSTR